jgi:hypothetical protein
MKRRNNQTFEPSNTGTLEEEGVKIWVPMPSNRIGNYWFLPSISEVIFIIILVFILKGPVNLLGDADTGYHIRTGEYIINNLKVPTYDIFSHISPPLTWTAHEWFSEVIFALIYKAFGLTGIVVTVAILIASVYAVLLRFLKSSNISAIVSVFIASLAAGASSIHWLARPHIFSLLLVLVWYMILDTYQYKQKNYLYLLPPIMLLWVNLHGGFIAGLILLAVYIMGNTLMAVFGKEERQEKISKIKKLSLFFVLCLLIALINPRGYEILFFPIKLVSNKFIMNNVMEFLSPNFHNSLKFEYMLLLMILVFSASVLRLNAIEILLVLLFTHMSLYSARYIPLYAIVASPIIGRRAENLLHDLSGNKLVKKIIAISDRTAKTESMIKFPLWATVTVILLASMVFAGRLQYGFDKKRLPADAVQFLKKEKLPGNMFNNDEFGDYIIYAAWPQYKVMFDGRSDMYGEKIGEDYLKVMHIANGWKDVLRKYNINWVIFNNKSVLSAFLLERADWRLIYSDKVANIFVRNTPEYQSLINKYPDVKPVVVKDEEKEGDK